MSDNVSRQAVLSILNGFEVMDGHTDQQRAIHMVELLPSTDRKGHWICNGGEDWICSNCGVETHADEDYRVDDARAYKMNFCHYCGADMRGV